MQSRPKRLLVIQAAALGHELLIRNNVKSLCNMDLMPIDTVFPALTCTVQAGFRTAATASEHGMIGNGFFHSELMRPMFWEQSSRLVGGHRIWDAVRATGKKVAMLFWQQSLGESVDYLVSPAPIHKHHGGMIQSCYSKPADLYDRLARQVGGGFNLKHYWGPAASYRSSDWIARATCALLADPDTKPDLCLTYLPALDYDLQRYGPDTPEAATALRYLCRELDEIADVALSNEYEIVLFGDYAIARSDRGAVQPNLALKQAGLFKVRDIAGKAYPDFYESASFAIVDHEIAHIYIRSQEKTAQTIDLLCNLPGVKQVLDKKEQTILGVMHPRSGELLLIAEDGYWFAYPWWENEHEAPDFARHVDIHNKPGYDPCELFLGRWLPPSITRDHSKIKGTHGRVGKDRQVAFASTLPFKKTPASLLELSRLVANWLDDCGRSDL